ncbi:peptidoglycan DD-metalloendopeptidase family protein [Nocardia asteroides]|uniref:peptidoglycan DD-metalloendopeptidase family protein n=1 Tax=Nocardia asteroides TaxID=1824 RepID=UPI0037C758B3
MTSTARIGISIASGVMLLLTFLLLVAGIDDNACAAATGSGSPTHTAPGAKTMPLASGTFTLTSGFGMRWGEQHQGQDFAAEPKTPIYAVADGVVVRAGRASGFGFWVVIDHNIDRQVVSSVYGHMFAADVVVREGDTVRIGQQIGAVGYNGQTVPTGPDGAHLHLEIWTGGGRFGGGTAIDPMPWLQTSDTSPSTTTSRTSTAPVQRESAVEGQSGAELPALPASIGSEAGLQVDTVRVARTVAVEFPQIQTMYGQREDPLPDHPSGRALDIMIPNPTSGNGKILGDQIADYLIANAPALRVVYIIWRQTYRTATGEFNLMEDRGGDTANHMDHVHVTTMGGGYPDGAPIESAATNPTAAGPAECAGSAGESDLSPGSVPADLEPWYRQGGAVCPQASASLLAAQGKQESGFRRGLTSSSGAQGLAQFLPGTATALAADGRPYVIDADGNGVASVWEDGDAIIGQARYMCDIAAKIEGWIAEGKVSGDLTTLTLAGYNAGEGAVLRSGGFPTGSTDYEIQTRPYVANILATAAQMSTSMS